MTSVHSAVQINVFKGCVNENRAHATFDHVYLGSIVQCIYFRISSELTNFADANAVNRNPTSAAAAAPAAPAARKKDSSFNIDHLVSSSVRPPPRQKVGAPCLKGTVIAPQPPQPPRSSNLLQLLNDPPKKQQE